MMLSFSIIPAFARKRNIDGSRKYGGENEKNLTNLTHMILLYAVNQQHFFKGESIMSNIAVYVTIFILLGISWLMKKIENDPEFVLRLMKKSNEMERDLEEKKSKLEKFKKTREARREKTEAQNNEHISLLKKALQNGNEEDILREEEKIRDRITELLLPLPFLVKPFLYFLNRKFEKARRKYGREVK